MRKSALNYKDYIELYVKLEKRDATLQDTKKTANKLVKSGQETRQLLQDTLNVKLRYEEIIKAIMENEKKASKARSSVEEIIARTQASKVV